MHWVLAAADRGLSTPAVYAELDRIRPEAPPPQLPAELLAAVAQGDADKLALHLRNDLQAAAVNLAPRLTDTLVAGLKLGALAGVVSGSGPTCLFLVADRSQAETVASGLAGHCRFARAVVTGAQTMTGAVA